MIRINHRRGGINPNAALLYAPVRDDRIADVLEHGLRKEPFPAGEHAVLLLETLQAARDHGRDTYGVDEDDVTVVAVDVSGYGAELYDDFRDHRRHEFYSVFGRHTYLLRDIPAGRLTLIPSASPVVHSLG